LTLYLVAHKVFATSLLQEEGQVAKEDWQKVDEDVADEVHALVRRVRAEDANPFCSHVRRQKSSFSPCVFFLTLIVIGHIVHDGVDLRLLKVVLAVQAGHPGQEPGDGQGLA